MNPAGGGQIVSGQPGRVGLHGADVTQGKERGAGVGKRPPSVKPEALPRERKRPSVWAEPKFEWRFTMATNSNLVGTWTIKAAGYASGLTSVPHFQEGYTVEITETSITVNPSGPTLAEGTDFHMGPGMIRAEFSYSAGSATHHAYVMCILPEDLSDPNSVSVIIGGSTKGDPDTVAVWGGDDRP